MESNETNQLMIVGGIFLALLVILGAVIFTPRKTSDVLGASVNRPQGMVQLVPVEDINGAVYSPRQ